MDSSIFSQYAYLNAYFYYTQFSRSLYSYIQCNIPKSTRDELMFKEPYWADTGLDFWPSCILVHNGVKYFLNSRLYSKASPKLQLDYKPIPVVKIGFFLCSISHWEKPVLITWEPCLENRFFPTSQWKPYSGPVLALYGIAVWLNIWSIQDLIIIIVRYLLYTKF